MRPSVIHQIQAECGEAIAEAVRRGYRHWFEDHNPEALVHLSSRTRASYASDRIWQEVNAALAHDLRFKPLRRGQQRFLEFDQSALIKIKKIDGQHRPANIPTGAVRRFMAGEPVFPGFDDRAPCVLGFRLDPLGDAVEFVALLRPDLAANRLVVLYDSRVQDARTLEFAQEPATQPDNRAIRRRVRPKRSDDRGRVSG